MSMLAILAAKHAAIASGLGTGLVPAFGGGTVDGGTVDGFAVGLLVSGIVFLLVTAQRNVLRRDTGVARSRRRVSVPRLPGPVLGHYPGLGLPSKLADSAGVADDLLAAPVTRPAERPEPADEPGLPRRSGGYRSKHRLDGTEACQSPPERTGKGPRHAAPSSALGRIVALVQLKAMAVRD